MDASCPHPAIFLSHRIAGPLYRLERHLLEVAKGKEPKDSNFRKGDYYQPLAEACNKVMARMRDASIWSNILLDIKIGPK